MGRLIFVAGMVAALVGIGAGFFRDRQVIREPTPDQATAAWQGPPELASSRPGEQPVAIAIQTRGNAAEQVADDAPLPEAIPPSNSPGNEAPQHTPAVLSVTSSNIGRLFDRSPSEALSLLNAAFESQQEDPDWASRATREFLAQANAMGLPAMSESMTIGCRETICLIMVENVSHEFNIPGLSQRLRDTDLFNFVRWEFIGENVRFDLLDPRFRYEVEVP